MSAILIGSFFVLLLLGLPLAFAMGVAAIGLILGHGVFPLSLVPQRALLGADAFALLAIPFFILAGNLMNRGGMTDRIIGVANAVVGRFTGGLAMGNVAASLFFGGVSGSAVADTTAVGSTLIPAMKKEGYGGPFSAAITAASSICGPIIPPSIPLVLYALIAGGGVSIGALFLAGIVPGLMLGFGLMALSWIIARRRGYPVHGAVSPRVFLMRLASALPALVMPAIILVGVVGGVFTVTESAAIAVLYALLVGTLVYRELTKKDLAEVLSRSALEAAAVMIIVAMASLFGWLMAVTGLPRQLSNLLLSITDDPLLLLLVINVLLLVIGIFLEAIAALTIFVPILVPIVLMYGIDPVHFGVIVVFNLMLGLLTPPVGICLYIAGQFAQARIEAVFREVVPFFLLGFGVLLLITLFPGLVLFLPRLFMG
ncbi:TRAP transporter large permease [Aquibaculum sediminis]|uniref:TRAP transporter large permease n=1 Tax=Aquibaculum sediminis TaxID=3231907 RepID=UPI003452503B